MKPNIFWTGLLLLTLCACSNDDLSTNPDDSNISNEKNRSSSSILAPESSNTSSEGISSSSSDKLSSSIKDFSSSSVPHALCKVSGDWGNSDGCLKKDPEGQGDLWSTGNLKVNTKIYINDSVTFGEKAGDFFFETDSAKGGKTQIIWGDGRVILPSFNGLLNANVRLDKGSLPCDPFFIIGFYVAGFDSNGLAIPTDISSWNGICILYEGSISPTLQLDLGETINQKIGFSLPSVKVSSQKEPQCFEWNQFQQPDFNGEFEHISGEEAAKKVVRIIFLFQEQPNVELDGYEIIEFIAIGTNRDS